MLFPYHLIDLTHSLDAHIPTWDGQCGFSHEIFSDYDHEGDSQNCFRVMKIAMWAGIGTHVDAPRHHRSDGQSIEKFNITELCMPCAVIDVSHQCFDRYCVTKGDILGFENQHGPIQSGMCVMIRTGWARFWSEPEKYHNNHVFPSVSHEASALLIQRNVAALGIDTLSPDRPEDGFKVHHAFLGCGKLLLENVAFLEKMPPVGGYVLIAPLKIKDGAEAPVRLIGMIKKITE